MYDYNNTDRLYILFMYVNIPSMFVKKRFLKPHKKERWIK